MPKDTFQQLSLFPERVYSCHFKGCVEPIVGSSTRRKDKHVCKEHNALEWATSLSNSRLDVWRLFGEQWLAKIKEKTL